MGGRRRNLVIIGLVLGLLAASGIVIATKKPVLGLDLSGGTQLVYQARPTPQTPEVTPDAIDRAIEIIRKRTDTLLQGRTLQGRTAVVMPIYNEDTTRVAAGLDVIWSSLQAQAQQAAFDLFILSDTRKRKSPRPKKRQWRALVQRHGARGRIFYRRREENIGRKAGNIADFVRQWGGAYDYAVVLDADSIMSGYGIGVARPDDGCTSGSGHHPGSAGAGRPRDAVRAAGAVRRAPEQPDAVERPGVLAAR